MSVNFHRYFIEIHSTRSAVIAIEHHLLGVVVLCGSIVAHERVASCGCAVKAVVVRRVEDRKAVLLGAVASVGAGTSACRYSRSSSSYSSARSIMSWTCSRTSSLRNIIMSARRNFSGYNTTPMGPR